MTVLALSFVVFAIAFAGMAIGVLFRGRGIRPCHGGSQTTDQEGEVVCQGCVFTLRRCKAPGSLPSDTSASRGLK